MSSWTIRAPLRKTNTGVWSRVKGSRSISAHDQARRVIKWEGVDKRLFRHSWQVSCAGGRDPGNKTTEGEGEKDEESLPRLKRMKGCKRAVWRRLGTFQKRRAGPEGTSGLKFHGNILE